MTDGAKSKGFLRASAQEVMAPAMVRAQHRALLLQLLWEHREISRADLARLTGMSRSTVSAIVSDILPTGLVEETRAGSSSGGRKPIMLGFVDDARAIVGVDIGASHVGVAVVDLRGRVLHWSEEAAATRGDPDGTLARVESLIDRALTVSRTRDRLFGIGVSLPCPFDPQTGRPVKEVLPAWSQVDVDAVLGRVFSVPVRHDNDANLGALAELWWGAAHREGNVVFVKVATGIGAGLVVDGQILRGQHGTAGELGHFSIDPNGPPCVCGANGCLNVIIGTPALLARAEARRPHFPDSRLPRQGLDVDALVDAALDGDPLAREIIAFAGERLGEGLASLLNLMDPDAIVVGGTITRAGDHLLEPIRSTVRRRMRLVPLSVERVVGTEMDRHGIAIGAATLILEAALKNHEIPLLASVAVQARQMA